MDLNVQAIIGALILAGILWIAKTLNKQSEDLAVLRVVLMGADGRTGLVARVDALHAANNLAFREELATAVAELNHAKEELAEERRHTKRRQEDRAS